MKATKFETEPCSRCGGSGKYSYCQTHGSRCFKCSGTGQQFTKRGLAAAQYLKALRTVKAADVVFGQYVRIDSVPGVSGSGYFQVESIHTSINAGRSLDSATGEFRPFNHLVLSGTTSKGLHHSLHTFPGAEVSLVPTKQDAEMQITEALNYQASLTKAGKVAKRA